MKFGRRILIPLTFASVVGIHFAWLARGQDAGEWLTLTEDEVATVLPTYLSSGSIWLGLSYGLAGASATFCLLRLYEYRKRAVAGAVGGVTGVAVLYLGVCFLTGCCGSPMLAVYLSLFGARFLGITKPLVFGVTTLSVLVGYVWVTRKAGDPCACSADAPAGSDPECCAPPVAGLQDAAAQAEDAEQPCCLVGQSAAATVCGPGAVLSEQQTTKWVTGWVLTPVGRVRQVATTLQFSDHLGSWKARWGVGRMRYQVQPGLYAAGNPTPDSPVLVTANYKLTFDRLRRELEGLDAWIVVLDTEGINVWCSAGKGTFGAEEIARRVQASGLSDVVSHRTLILPQLSASGVAAHEVKKATDFRVVYGPVRAKDIPEFLAAGMRATSQMRRVTFTLWDRLVLVPIELTAGAKYSVLVMLGLFAVAGLGRWGYSLEAAWSLGWRAALVYLTGFLAGAVVTPLLLPWLPGRAFSLKGAVVGLLVAGAWLACFWPGATTPDGWFEVLALLSVLPAVSAFFAMNFTGASTYTSLSGVRREMRMAVPAQVAGVVIGLGLWLTAHFV